MAGFYLNHYHLRRFAIPSLKEIGDVALNVIALCTEMSRELSMATEMPVSFQAAMSVGLGVDTLSIHLFYRQLPVEAPEITVGAT
jgi:hypothetical protein